MAGGREVGSSSGDEPGHGGKGLIRKDLFDPDKKPGLYHQVVGWRGILNDGQVPRGLCLSILTLMVR